MPDSAIGRVDHALEVVQLTDSHLFGEPQGQLLGLDTYDSLQRVIELVLAERSRIDLVLATGDLSQDGSTDSYRYFRQLSERIAAPVRWCPGNHDQRENMHEVARSSGLMNPVLDLGNWRIVLLDSLIPGKVFGRLHAAQLALLDKTLGEAPERHCLVCLHHHPVVIGSRWMDRLGLRNAAALFDILARHAQVRVLLWGHIHQEFDQVRDGLRLLASPSTCVQFEPGSKTFQVSSQAPGYRWLRLYEDGRLDTGVSRITGFEFQVGADIKGY